MVAHEVVADLASEDREVAMRAAFQLGFRAGLISMSNWQVSTFLALTALPFAFLAGALF